MVAKFTLVPRSLNFFLEKEGKFFLHYLLYSISVNCVPEKTLVVISLWEGGDWLRKHLAFFSDLNLESQRPKLFPSVALLAETSGEGQSQKSICH